MFYCTTCGPHYPICNSMDSQDCHLVQMLANNNKETYLQAQKLMLEVYQNDIEVENADIFGT